MKPSTVTENNPVAFDELNRSLVDIFEFQESRRWFTTEMLFTNETIQYSRNTIQGQSMLNTRNEFLLKYPKAFKMVKKLKYPNPKFLPSQTWKTNNWYAFTTTNHKSSSCYIIPWMVMGGTDLYDMRSWMHYHLHLNII
jgi:hypothetical protein